MARYCLKAVCPDARGIVAAVAEALASQGGNIVDLAQHTVSERQLFMLRAEFEAEKAPQLDAVAKKLSMRWELHDLAKRPKVALLASQTDHCLYELLLKHADGHLPCSFTSVISNHSDLGSVAKHFDLPFYHLPVAEGQQAAHEAAVQAQLEKDGAEIVVLARYMRILSPAFVGRWSERLLNIHHGFLPAFQGAKPYHQAWDKGVKLIGATAHFATAELDQGPIVAQGVLRASDKSSVNDLVELGKDVERQVLVTALRTVLEHRVFVDGGRTFILD